MNARTLTTVLLRVWGVTAVFQALISLGPYVVTLFFPSTGPDAGMYRTVLVSNAAGIILSAFAGLMLIRFASAISSRLFEPNAEPPLVIAPVALLQAFLVTLGLYLFVQGLKHASAIGLELVLKPSWDPASAVETAWVRQRYALVSGAAELLAGAAIVWFRERLSNILGAPAVAALIESSSVTE